MATSFSYHARFPDIMRKTIKNGHQSAILNIISAKFVMGYPCETLHFIYIHGPAILHCFSVM